jgi:hypothetical protein
MRRSISNQTAAKQAGYVAKNIDLVQQQLALSKQRISLNERSLDIKSRSIAIDERSLDIADRSLDLDYRGLDLEVQGLGLQKQSLDLRGKSLDLSQRSLDENKSHNAANFKLAQDSIDLQSRSNTINRKYNETQGILNIIGASFNLVGSLANLGLTIDDAINKRDANANNSDLIKGTNAFTEFVNSGLQTGSLYMNNEGNIVDKQGRTLTQISADFKNTYNSLFDENSISASGAQKAKNTFSQAIDQTISQANGKALSQMVNDSNGLANQNLQNAVTFAAQQGTSQAFEAIDSIVENSFMGLTPQAKEAMKMAARQDAQYGYIRNEIAKTARNEGTAAALQRVQAIQDNPTYTDSQGNTHTLTEEQVRGLTSLATSEGGIREATAKQTSSNSYYESVGNGMSPAQAIEKVLASGELNDEDKPAVLKMLRTEQKITEQLKFSDRYNKANTIDEVLAALEGYSPGGAYDSAMKGIEDDQTRYITAFQNRLNALLKVEENERSAIDKENAQSEVPTGKMTTDEWKNSADLLYNDYVNKRTNPVTGKAYTIADLSEYALYAMEHGAPNAAVSDLLTKAMVGGKAQNRLGYEFAAPKLNAAYEDAKKTKGADPARLAEVYQNAMLNLGDMIGNNATEQEVSQFIDTTRALMGAGQVSLKPMADMLMNGIMNDGKVPGRLKEAMQSGQLDDVFFSVEGQQYSVIPGGIETAKQMQAHEQSILAKAGVNVISANFIRQSNGLGGEDDIGADSVYRGDDGNMYRVRREKGQDLIQVQESGGGWKPYVTKQETERYTQTLASMRKEIGNVNEITPGMVIDSGFLFKDNDQRAQAFVDLGYNPQTLKKFDTLNEKPPSFGAPIQSWKQMSEGERKSIWAKYFKELWQ